MRQFWIIVIHYAAQLQNHLSAKKLGEENPKIRKALFKKFSNDFVDAFYELHQTGTHFEVWIALENLMLHTIKKLFWVYF